MAVITIDTYQMVRTLKAGGFTKEQASSIVKVIESVNFNEMATKADLRDAVNDIRVEMYKAMGIQAIGLIGAMIAIAQFTS